MQREFETKQIEAQHIVGIRTTATMDKIGEVMGPMFGEVYGHIQQSGQAAGRYAFCDLSLDGRQHRRPRMRNARSLADSQERNASGQASFPPEPWQRSPTWGRTTPFGQTWSALTEWMASQGLQPAGAPWEVYVTDPGKVTDQSKWRTDIFFPVQ